MELLQQKKVACQDFLKTEMGQTGGCPSIRSFVNEVVCLQRSWNSGSGKGRVLVLCMTLTHNSFLAGIWSTALPALAITLFLVARDNVLNPQKQNWSLHCCFVCL